METVKAEVIVRFRDKHTKVVHSTVYEGSEDRVNELAALGFVKVIQEESPDDPGGLDSVLEGNVQEVKTNIDGHDAESLKSILALEKEGQNRKGVTEHIEQLITVVEGE